MYIINYKPEKVILTYAYKRVGVLEIVEMHVDEFHLGREALHKFGGKLSIRIPFDSVNLRPIMIFIQDECIWRAYDASKKQWKQKGGGGIRKKGDGKGCMISCFVSEEVGFASFSENEWNEFIEFRRVMKGRNKEPFFFLVKFDRMYYPTMHMFEYGKEREGYWTGDNMVEQIEECMDALEFKFPMFQFMFQFDFSSGHAKYPEGARMFTA
jgi:hypothetical protein